MAGMSDEVKSLDGRTFELTRDDPKWRANLEEYRRNAAYSFAITGTTARPDDGQPVRVGAPSGGTLQHDAPGPIADAPALLDALAHTYGCSIRHAEPAFPCGACDAAEALLRKHGRR